MKNSNDKSLRSMCARIGSSPLKSGWQSRSATFAIGSGTALAARHGDGGHGGYHGGYHGGSHGGYHGGYHGGHWGGGYYAPGPDIYVAPEPYAYGYGGPAPCYGPYYEEVRSAAIPGRQSVLWTLICMTRGGMLQSLGAAMKSVDTIAAPF